MKRPLWSRAQSGAIEVATSRSPDRPSSERVTVMTQAGLCGFAAIVSILRAVRTGTLEHQGVEVPDETRGVALASIAALLALGAAAVTFRSRRWAAIPLAAALLMELTVLLNVVAPPRIVNAIPLLFALGLAIAPAGWDPVRVSVASGQMRSLVAVVSIGLMVPLGLAYLIGPHIIAPYPDIYISYLLYAVLVTVTMVLARRRSWWIAAIPFVSTGLFLLMVQIGVAYRDWGG